jgi:hypothetical protein
MLIVKSLLGFISNLQDLNQDLVLSQPLPYLPIQLWHICRPSLRLRSILRRVPDLRLQLIILLHTAVQQIKQRQLDGHRALGFVKYINPPDGHRVMDPWLDEKIQGVFAGIVFVVYFLNDVEFEAHDLVRGDQESVLGRGFEHMLCDITY